MWCWLASSEMVNKYHGVRSLDKDPDMQCSVMRYMASAGLVVSNCYFNCFECPYPAFRSENLKIPLDNYSAQAALNGGNSVTSELVRKAPSFSRIKREIKQKRPILAGVNPSLRGITAAEPEHMVVVIGYTERNGKKYVRVNDPYEYTQKDPYVSLGATRISDGVYDILYEEFLKSFAWQTTIYVRNSK